MIREFFLNLNYSSDPLFVDSIMIDKLIKFWYSTAKNRGTTSASFTRTTNEPMDYGSTTHHIFG